MTLLAKTVWRCIWPSWDRGEEARALALFKAHPPGGITLFRRHVPDLQTTGELNRKILTATALATRIAIDEEGGPVRRLPPPFPAFPAAASWEQLGYSAAQVEREHWRLGRLLVALGFAIDFAPVADLCFDVNHPALKDRCFSASPQKAAELVTAAVRGLQAAGLSACAKHFPGHGAVALDSHINLDTLERSPSQVAATELISFRAAFANQVALTMAAHFKWPSFDHQQPTTFSAKLIELLRRDLAYSGVILTDDLEMGAIAANWPKDEAALMALSAGYDAVLYCKSIETAERAAEFVIREAERSPALRAHLMVASARIDHLAVTPASAIQTPAQLATLINQVNWNT